MGFLTTIVISNDRINEFLSNPEELVKTIRDGMSQTYMSGKSASLKGNYIKIHPSRHANDETVYVHTGNSVYSLNSYDWDFKDLAHNNPKLAKDFIMRAQRILNESKKYLKSKIDKQ